MTWTRYDYPSTADITHRVIEAFSLVLELATEHVVDEQLLDSIALACGRVIGFVQLQQESNGSWFGRWGCNYTCGTCFVLCGLSSFYP